MTPGPVPPRGYWAKFQNRALPTLVAAGEHPSLPDVLDGLLTANKVAREFEFTPLHHTVRQFSDFSENRSKSASCARSA